jgi:hypothetical protein
MVYTPQTNWKYDKNLYHPIQSGPQRTADNLDLTDTYSTISSEYVTPSGISQTWYGVNDEGADFGRIPVGPPNLSGYFTSEWRAVPPAVSGYWNDFNDTYLGFSPYSINGTPYPPLLDVYEGFRAQSLIYTANATIQTAFGPRPGLRNFGTHTWYGEQIPDNQLYSPFKTPSSNDNTVDGGGITGGGVTHPTVQSPTLTNPTNDTTGSRAAWVYHYPIYCQSFTETRYTGVPGQMGAPTRNSYRGKSLRYVPNYGSVYGVLGEGVRNMVRTFSPGTKI